MSEIQRYDIDNGASKWGYGMHRDKGGDWVTYADHLTAMQQAFSDGVEWGENSQDTHWKLGYDKGRAKGRADALDEAIQAVEALRGETEHTLPRWFKADALAALRALRDGGAS